MSKDRKIDQNISNEPHFPGLEMFAEQTKMKVLLVKAGLAPAGVLAVEGATSIEAATILCEQDIIELGMVVESRIKDKWVSFVYYARNQVDLKKLLMAETDAEQGDALGFPKTAVDAYPNGIIGDKELPPEIINDPFFELIDFMLSRENYIQEWSDFRAKITKVGELLPNEVKMLGLESYFSVIE